MQNSLKKSLKKHWDKLIIAGLISLYGFILATFSILRHNAFASNFDLSNMDHTVWNTLYGNFFSLRYEEIYVSRLSVHADFILILLSPLYIIWNDVRALLVTQAVIVALGAIPAYLISQKILKNKLISLSLVLAYLLNPNMMWSIIYDFHPVTLAIPFLLFSFYFAFSKKWNLFALFALLAILTKEQISLFFVMLGIYIIFILKETKIGIATIIFSLIWFILMVFYFIPNSSLEKNYWALSIFQSNIGVQENSLKIKTEALIEPFTIKSLEYYNGLLKPYAYLPLLGLPWLLISLPELVINIYGMDTMKTIYYHYDSGIIPSLVISSIFGIYYLLLFLRKIKYFKKQYKYFPLIISIGIILVALRINYIYSPLPNTPSCWCFIYKVTDEDRAFEAALQKLPKDASLAASLEVRPHVNHRKDVWFVPSATSSAQFVALITQNRMIGNYEPKIYENQLIKILQSSSQHKILFQSEHFYLFEKISDK